MTTRTQCDWCASDIVRHLTSAWRVERTAGTIRFGEPEGWDFCSVDCLASWSGDRLDRSVDRPNNPLIPDNAK